LSVAKGGEPPPSRLWAVKDVSLEIRRGEVVCFMGRNGAGKSTLLSLLARITAPTCGRAEIFGRVGALLQVGAGFHPEFTGRENVYLGGTLLGMTPAEVNERYEAIVRFADIGAFLDTPVKFYSSGMRIRLGFSIAAHLEPDVLIVDEALAVGDQYFREKSLDKTRSLVSDSDRTVLLVSHALSTVLEVGTRGIVMSGGQIVHDAPIKDAAEYFQKAA
jgi:lipopolysaccharide transport system ATP-binding protein